MHVCWGSYLNNSNLVCCEAAKCLRTKHTLTREKNTVRAYFIHEEAGAQAYVWIRMNALSGGCHRNARSKNRNDRRDARCSRWRTTTTNRGPVHAIALFFVPCRHSHEPFGRSRMCGWSRGGTRHAVVVSAKCVFCSCVWLCVCAR